MYIDHIQALNNTEAIQTIFSILSKGHSVELPAKGYSMFPAIRPGERVIVRPVGKDEKLERGDVIVWYEKGATAQRHSGATVEEPLGMFVMHRLIEIRKDDSGKTIYITRGDSLEWIDEPWHMDQLVGVAVSKKSGNKERKIRSFVPSGLRYRVNWWLLWGWGKLVQHFRFQVPG